MLSVSRETGFSEEDECWLGAIDYYIAKIPERFREDARQDVLVRVLEARLRYEKHNARGASMGTFMRHQIRHAVQDFWRQADPLKRDHRKKIQQGKLPPVIHCVEKSAYRKAATDKAPDDQAISQQVHRLLLDLEPRERYLIEQSFFHNRSMRELGKEFGVTYGTVWLWKNQALERLREILEISSPSLITPATATALVAALKLMLGVSSNADSAEISTAL